MTARVMLFGIMLTIIGIGGFITATELRLAGIREQAGAPRPGVGAAAAGREGPMKELARLCGRLLLRGAAWAAYTLVLAVIAGAAVRAVNCRDASCPPWSEAPVVALAVCLAIVGSLAMVWAGALTRRWLALRPGDRRWLVTGVFYTSFTLPLVTVATATTLEIVDGMAVAERAVRASDVWQMDARVREIESNVRALMLAVGAQDGGPTYRFMEQDAAAARACADPFGRIQ